MSSLPSSNDVPQSQPVSSRDCFACKMTGAVGCFGGATYAMYQRAKMSPGNRNRHWLLALSIGTETARRYVDSDM